MGVILSGMRPTGALHLGHYLGVIKNWVELQDQHKCFFFVADWHAMTSNYDNTSVIRDSRLEYVRGWLACGVDPQKAIIYKQSDIAEILYLDRIFLCLTPPGWADRSPSWKDLSVNPNKRLDNMGFYSYPVLMATDIAIVNANLVPVGEDQTTHVEIAREIVRKFNRTYKANIVEPQPLFTSIPKLLGTDGRKMSSSIGNVITLRETEKSLQKKVNGMKTDDMRNGIENPGNPENCSVFDYHKIFSPESQRLEIAEACRGAKLGCGECKQKLGACMKTELLPIAEKMNKITDDDCLQVLGEGTKKAQEIITANWLSLKVKVGF